MVTKNIKYRSDIVANRQKYETNVDIESHVIADNRWTRGLFMCYDDCGLCCITGFFPCVTFGMNAAQIEMGSCCIMATACLIPVLNCFCMQRVRTRIREIYGVHGSKFNDMFLVCVFWPCTISQESAELKTQPGKVIARSWW